MSILIDAKTNVLIQGISGREGSRAAREMKSYGTRVVAGVTPGKGGEKVEGVPVYETVKQAMAKHPDITASLIIVPPAFVKDAALEAMHAGVSLLLIITEHVPVYDTACIIAWSKRLGVRIVGPNSIGIMSPGKAKIGSIGSGETRSVFTSGPVGVISKSGGMTAEIAVNLTRAKIGQSTVVGIGGDPLIGSDFVDILKLFEKDAQTKAIVMFGEIGGTYEEQAAEYIRARKFKKPIVAVIAGKFTESLPEETLLGHAGAIVSKGRGGYTSKISSLKRAGVTIVHTIDALPGALRTILKMKPPKKQ